MSIWSAEIKELEKLHESLKGQFPDLEKELEQLIRTEDANVIMLYSRRCPKEYYDLKEKVGWFTFRINSDYRDCICSFMEKPVIRLLY
jgi:hypothetical protein